MSENQQRDETADGSNSLQEDVFYVDTDRDLTGTNREWLGMDIHPVLFPVSLLVIAVFLVSTVMLGETATRVYESLFVFINANFGWFYILAVNLFIGALLYFGVSKYGDIRIGGIGSTPDYTTFEWMAMLFSAGMGIGLMFWSVAEPMYHLGSGGGTMFPFDPNTGEAARAALGITYFHWGLHPWAIYGLVALGLSFFAFNRGLPLTFRSMFYPLLGDRIYDWPGHLVDLVTIFATVFGLATSLGLGAAQINAGLSIVGGQYTGLGSVPVGTVSQLAIIAVITAITGLSVWAGIDSGLKRLSTINVYLMVLLMVFLLVAGPTRYLLASIVQTVGFYLQNLPHMSLFTETMLGGLADQAAKAANWQDQWTIFYWGWWIAWSPFVGLFIARISKGRSVRQIVAGVLLLPTGFSFVWLGTLGGLAIYTQTRLGGAIQQVVVEQGKAYAMFELLASFPLASLTSMVAVAVVVTFFVTSADSGSQVIALVSSGGKLDVPQLQRMIWAVTVGGVAAALLVGGGLAALQTAAITTGLPFAAILIVLIYTLYRGLSAEYETLTSPSFREKLRHRAEADDIDRPVGDRWGTVGHSRRDTGGLPSTDDD